MPTEHERLQAVADIIELADNFSSISDALHVRVMTGIRGRQDDIGAPLNEHVAQHLLESEIALRQFSNALFLDADHSAFKAVALPLKNIVTAVINARETIPAIKDWAELFNCADMLVSLAKAVVTMNSALATFAVERLDTYVHSVGYGERLRPDIYTIPTIPETKSWDLPDITSRVTAFDLLNAPHSGDVWEQDEGSNPDRFPSIKANRRLASGVSIVIIVNLKRHKSAHTQGPSLSISSQPKDWTSLELEVTLVSARIDFEDDGKGRITVIRNSDSVAARIKGRVSNKVKQGETVEVHAQFWDGTRCCGSAVRCFGVGTSDHRPTPENAGVSIPTKAAKPDVTVYITVLDPLAPGNMHWRIVTAPFTGLPAKLDGMIQLGSAPGMEAKALFSEFANLPRGQHQTVIEGFGERLWRLSPAVFKEAYWALHDHYNKPLAIQFTSDDPYLPWELMRPMRHNETHEPLALRHAVARWIGSYQGWMKNELPSGALVVVAPRYASLATRLSIAERTAAELVKDYRAAKVPGTRTALLSLLENPPPTTVGMLYFTGHGSFNDSAPSMSAIKLEAGALLHTLDIDREAVQLGKVHGSVIFLNACEVGATGTAFGEIGGWANAFLAQQFRAFIAPLWAVDEEDAANVSRILIEKMVTQHMPLGQALRDIRREFGSVSPTFYSYLLYGDVTAQVAQSKKRPRRKKNSTDPLRY